MSKPRIQPEGEIGPNNAGKMIVRSICYAFNLDKYPDLKKEVEAFLEARGTASGVHLPKTRYYGTEEITPEEVEFISKLIKEFKEFEFKPEEIPKKTVAELGKKQQEVVEKSYELLAEFFVGQEKKGNPVHIKEAAYIITGNVKDRDPVTYADTLNWDVVERFDEKKEMDEKEEEKAVGTYSPPSVSLSQTPFNLFEGMTFADEETKNPAPKVNASEEKDAAPKSKKNS